MTDPAEPRRNENTTGIFYIHLDLNSNFSIHLNFSSNFSYPPCNITLQYELDIIYISLHLRHDCHDNYFLHNYAVKSSVRT